MNKVTLCNVESMTSYIDEIMGQKDQEPKKQYFFPLSINTI